MIDIQSFSAFLAGALLLNITPGADVAFATATTARNGRRAGYAAAFGIGAGSLIWSVLTAAGFAAAISASEHSYPVIRLIGGFYLLYLAVQVVVRPEPDDAAAPGAGNNMWAAFRQALTTNLLNPKVGLFFLAFLPVFTDQASGPLWRQILLLGAVFSVSSIVVLSCYVFGVGLLRRRFESARYFRIVLKALSALMFGGLGLFFLLTRTGV